MFFKKLARAIACKRCENPSKLYELQIHADEQAREILRLNHVLDEVKKERDAARKAADNAILRLYEGAGVLEAISAKNCENCGKKLPREAEARRTESLQLPLMAGRTGRSDCKKSV